jgi:replicative DNA helicase
MDALTGGFKRSDMIVIAARTSVGKTALALNVVANVCRAGKSAMFFSLEMAKEQLASRLLCIVGSVNSASLKTGFLKKQETPKLNEAFEQLSTWRLMIDDKANIPILELRAKALRQSSKQRLDLVVIDYLQLVAPPFRGENRQVEVAEVCKQIKALARDLSCPVLALSQLNREAEKDDAGMPKLSHLRESGAIEQDADVVILMAPVRGNKEIVEVRIAKQRNGPTGQFQLAFIKDKQKFGTVGNPGYEPMPERNYSAPVDAPRTPYKDEYEEDGYEDEALF